MKHFKKIIFAVLLIILSIHLVFRIVSYSKEYTAKFDPGYWKARYNESQWVVSGSKNSIGDDGLYAYAGWEYISGSNPTLLNAEIPPFGKYMIGAGEVIFQNQNILILLVGLLCLGTLYVLNLKLFKDKLLAFLPVFLLSFDPLFYSQLRAPYLDTMYLLFLLLSLLFTLRRKYFLSSFFLGCFASIKFPAGSLFLMLSLFSWVFLYDRKHIRKFLVSLILWPAVFLSSYCMYFIRGGSVLGFLGVQKWIFNFYATGVKSAPGTVYPMILFGTWHTWFAGLQKVTEWSIFWPVSFIASLFSALPLMQTLVKHVKSKLPAGKAGIPDRKSKIEDENMILILFWVAFYLIFLTFTPVFPRYLLLLLPFMYNLSIWFFIKYIFPRF